MDRANAVAGTVTRAPSSLARTSNTRTLRSSWCRGRAVAPEPGSRSSTMLGAFAVPRRPAWMLGLAAHRLRNLYARRRRRRRPSACRIAEPRHHRAERAERNGNSETDQPTAMLVNGASRSAGVGVRFIHRWQHARVRAVRPGIGADVSGSNARSAQQPSEIRVFDRSGNGH